MRRRFGSVGLVAGALASALVCYTVSLHVAAERSEVERTQRVIAADLRDIRALEAELRTRARLPQLQRWNDEVLAMAAPTSKQFAHGALALVAYAPNADDVDLPQRPNVQLAVASEPAVAEPSVRTVAYEAPSPKLQPPLQVAVAPQGFGLSASLMRQIDAAAEAERATFRKVSLR